MFLASVVACARAAKAADQPVRVAVAGLVHGHVDGFFRLAKSHPEMAIAGVFEPDTALQRKYGAKYGLKDELFFKDLATMLDRVKPDAVATFTNTFDHPVIVEACAARKVPVMMEKPMAVSNAHARRIQSAVTKSGVPLIVNYETTWYASHRAIWKMVKEQNSMGGVRKMVAMDGHNGPKEINVGPEFLGWLSDPERNGAGALFDFGCYGANLMTWFMDNARPLAVTAMVQRLKPETYPRVEDDADVLVEYPHAIGIIQGSWDWPFARKDFELYGSSGFAIATGGDSLRYRTGGNKEISEQPQPMPPADRDSVSYLVSVVRDHRKVEGLSSLENNMIVTEILDAARESARTGRRVQIRNAAHTEATAR